MAMHVAETLAARVSRGSDVDGAIGPGHVVSHQLSHRDRHPHRVAPLRVHDVGDRADEVLINIGTSLSRVIIIVSRG